MKSIISKLHGILVLLYRTIPAATTALFAAQRNDKKQTNKYAIAFKQSYFISTVH